jgi:hypothetical protein
VPFSTPQPVKELDLDDEQFDPWLSPDLRTIVFTSRHEEGTPRLYYATR